MVQPSFARVVPRGCMRPVTSLLPHKSCVLRQTCDNLAATVRSAGKKIKFAKAIFWPDAFDFFAWLCHSRFIEHVLAQTLDGRKGAESFHHYRLISVQG